MTDTLYIKKSTKATANYVGHERPRAEAHTRALTSVASIATMPPRGHGSVAGKRRTFSSKNMYEKRKTQRPGEKFCKVERIKEKSKNNLP